MNIKYVRIAIVLCGLGTLTWISAKPATEAVHLPSSKLLTARATGYIGRLNSFPATIALSPDARYAAILNDGYGTQDSQVRQSIAVLDLSDNQLTDFPDGRFGEDAHQSFFLGLAFSSDGKHLYASVGSITDPTGAHAGNTGNGIAVYSFANGKIAAERFIRIPPQKLAPGKKIAYGLRTPASGGAIPYPAGLAVISSQTGDRLLVANNLSDNVVLIDAASGQLLRTFDLSTKQLVPSAYPYTVVATRDGRRAWCSLWNESRVAELDLAAGKITRSVSLLAPKDHLAPGSHPTALLLSRDEKLLYVALANADRVAAVSTQNAGVVRWLDTQLEGQTGRGSYPNALAESLDGTRLFVANATNNAVAVFDTAHMNTNGAAQHALGFIPTEWYPSALATAGGDLLIATAKGESTGPNSGPSKTEGRRHRAHPYIATLLYGSLARLNYADVEKNLSAMTRTVVNANLFDSSPERIQFQGGHNPIRHVIYVIKENRTYDQVFGDLKVGNGDSSLVMFGADITPNQHKLALQFGVLDNFYDSGEVSGNGHEWSTAAITSDYNEQTWQIAYRGKERTYDFGGLVADEIPMDNDVADVDAPATGYLWDNLASHNVSYRDYGEYITTVWCKPERVGSPKSGTPSPLRERCPHAEVNKGEPLPANVGNPHGGVSPWPWPVPQIAATKPTKAALRGHFDPKFPDFNTDYPDQLRADEFLNEFANFVEARRTGKGQQLPAFVLLYLPDDHTGGTRPGHPRPAASLADNDLAVGRVVDAVSHSAYWDDTAIFVVEDDAQNGADHVDAHRSIALAISKYSPGTAGSPVVDHHFYTTVSMIHTIEDLLGLPPMNHNDAYAPLMAPLFTGAGNQPAFTADTRNRDNGLIYEVNGPHRPGAEESSRMDFSRPDAINSAALNAILWRDRKGDAPMPAARHSSFH